MQAMQAVLCVLLAVAAGASPVAENWLPALKIENDLPVQVARDMVGDNGNANDYIDMVLANLNPLLPAEVDLPNFKVADIKFTECFVFGLDNGIARDGDATMVTVEDTVKFTSALATNGTVGMQCHWHFVLMSGKASGTTDKISISSGISWKLTHGSSPQLTEFRVTEVAPIKTDITGLTIFFNWLAEDIADIIINDFKDQIVDVIQTTVAELFQQVLDQIVLP